MFITLNFSNILDVLDRIEQNFNMYIQIFSDILDLFSKTEKKCYYNYVTLGHFRTIHFAPVKVFKNNQIKLHTPKKLFCCRLCALREML